MVDKKKGEFGFIKGLMERLPRVGKDVIAGAGDDAGVIRFGDQYLLATTDALVEGVHFTSKFFSPEEVGRKAVAVNVSDIAAMGGKPMYCLVSLVLPKVLDRTRLYDGIIEECNKYGVEVIGGNISGGRELVVDIFMLGSVRPARMVLRSGARVGDKVLVTGSLGEAAAGLQLLIKNGKDGDKDLLISRQVRPVARVEEGLVIAESGMVSSMLDVSDGLGQDIGHICESSGVGVRIYEDKLPIGAGVEVAARMMGKSGLELALYGGEDYELCFTVAEDSVEEIARMIESKTGTRVSMVGEIVDEKEGRVLVFKDGKVVPLVGKGWDHLGS